MDDQCLHEVPVPTAADFVGSPFRMLPRIGDKMYRPTRPAVNAPKGPTPANRQSQQAGPGIWDWG